MRCKTKESLEQFAHVTTHLRIDSAVAQIMMIYLHPVTDNRVDKTREVGTIDKVSAETATFGNGARNNCGNSSSEDPLKDLENQETYKREVEEDGCMMGENYL